MSDPHATPTASLGATRTGADAPGAGLPPGAAEAVADLPRRAADAVQLVVDTIHDKAVRPAVLAARAVVFGLLVAVLATVLLVVAAVALVRLFDVYVFGHRVWLSYLLFGGVLTLGGLAAWSRRTARPSSAHPH